MVTLSLISFAATLSVAVAVEATSLSRTAEFHEWLGQHEKSYADDAELSLKMKTWMENDGKKNNCS